MKFTIDKTTLIKPLSHIQSIVERRNTIPILSNVFPTFAHYIVIMTMIGIPLLVFVGYVHWKRSGA